MPLLFEISNIVLFRSQHCQDAGRRGGMRPKSSVLNAMEAMRSASTDRSRRDRDRMRSVRCRVSCC